MLTLFGVTDSLHIETAGCDKIFRALRASGHHNFWRKLVVRFGEFITEGLLQLLWH